MGIGMETKLREVDLMRRWGVPPWSHASVEGGEASRSKSESVMLQEMVGSGQVEK
jgi:hypothetical protein